ncbi:MAG: hypothetical protein V3V06_07235 [Dehalococcoidia bacterium]
MQNQSFARRRAGVRLIAIAAIIAAAALLAGFALDRGEAKAQVSSTVNVELQEFSVTPDVTSVEEGDVTSVVTNAGTTPHEFWIIATDLAPDALPVSGSQVDTAQLNVVGNIEQFDAGLTMPLTVALTPGNYVLICNVPGHYQLGMFTAFTVTPHEEEAAPPEEEEAPAPEAEAPAMEAAPPTVDALPATGSGGLAADAAGNGPGALVWALTAAAATLAFGLLTRRLVGRRLRR